MLVGQWKTLGSELPDGWSSAELALELNSRGAADTASRLLAPTQPFRAGPTSLRFRVALDGTAPSPDGIQRLLRRIDGQRVAGTLSLTRTATRPTAAERPEPTLVESWDAEVARLPGDWSDLFAEIDLTSSDYLERASLLCAPLNPRRDGRRTALRFRAAARFGYGASPQMVRRCFERCDTEDIRGAVRILRALSDTKPVGTQGPVWLAAGTNF